MMSEEEYQEEVLEHKSQVSGNLNIARAILKDRDIKHDLSKLSVAESEIYRKYIGQLKDSEYNTPEYKDILEKMGSGLQHHYANNSHHPEYYTNGVSDMSIFDILEMLSDWKAAIENRGGSFLDGVVTNIKRFKIEEPLASIVQKTALEMVESVTLNPAQAKIISGFAGIGKSTAIDELESSGLKVLDLDSSNYSWLPDMDDPFSRIPDPEFPLNYVKAIAEQITNYDYIFISTHDSVLMTILATDFKKQVTIVSPTLHLKDAFEERYRKRNSPKGLIDTISKNWGMFIRSLELFEELGYHAVWIEEDNIFLSDLIKEGKF